MLGIEGVKYILKLSSNYNLNHDLYIYIKIHYTDISMYTNK